MSNFLPDQLIANVLLRLPFDSLIRFRSVSKSWRDLIDSAYFIELHSQTSRLIKLHPNPDSKVIVFQGSKFYTFDSVQKHGSIYKAIAKELHSPPFEFDDYGLEFVGSSDGLICLWNRNTDDLLLWNPWIQKYSALPLPPPPYEFTSQYRGCLGAAFHYDHINDDHKVVKWHTFADLCMHLNDLPSSDRYELCVYSLKQNSWKTIRDAIPFQLPEEYYLFFAQECAFANGALHWLVMDKPRYVEAFIVAFDLGTEEFRKISCDPCSIYSPYTFHQRVCSLNGCLCCLCYNTSGQRHSWDVWMMEDYGVESSWTKLSSIDSPPDLEHSRFTPVSCSKSRRKLLLQIDWKKLAIYDFQNRSFRDVCINGEARSVISCVCVGSLFSPCSSPV